MIAKIKKINPTAKTVIGNVLYPLLSVGIFLSVWAIAAAVNGQPYILPPPAEVFDLFFRLFGESGFWTAVGGTVGRTLLCFLISFVVAIVLAAVGGLFRPFHRVVAPIVGILRAVPTMSVILIIMLWIDIQNAPIFIGFLIAFPMMYSAFYSAISTVDADLIEMTKLYKVRPLDKVRYLYAPSIAESVFETSGATLSLTFKIVIAAEVLCYTLGSIGHEMQYAKLTFEISYLLAWTLLAVIISLLAELVTVVLKKIWRARK